MNNNSKCLYVLVKWKASELKSVSQKSVGLSPTRRARRTGVSKRIQTRQPKRGTTPVVEETVIDIVDEPLPGVVRLTEIEEIEVSVPDSEEEE